MRSLGRQPWRVVTLVLLGHAPSHFRHGLGRAAHEGIFGASVRGNGRWWILAAALEVVPSGVGPSERNGFEHEDWSRALHLFLVQDRFNLINSEGAELFCGRLPNFLLRHRKVLTCT